MTRSLLALLLLAAPSAALAQPPRSVSIEVTRCETGSFDALAVIDAARVELAADGIPDVHATAGPNDGAIAHIRIAFDCDDATTYSVHVDDLVTRKSVERTSTFDEIPASSVPRALAIAAAELLRASWAELEIVDAHSDSLPVVDALRVRVRALREAHELAPPTAAGPTPPVAPAPTPSPSEAPARVAIGAAGVVRAFPGGGAAPLGGRLFVDVPLTGGVHLAIDAETVFGTAIHPLGVIDLGLASGGLALRYDAAIDVVRVGLGVRAAAGGAWTQGHPTSSATTGATGGGLVLLVGGVVAVNIALGDFVSLRLDVEGGGAAVGFEAYVDRAPVAGFVGGYLAATLAALLYL